MKSEWIPIGQAEPPYNTNVLISCEFKDRKWITMGMLEESPDYDGDSEDDYYYAWRLDDVPLEAYARPEEVIRAWMPMPKPYEESEDEENA